MAEDINDYGRFETFYKVESKEKDEAWKLEEPKVLEDRPNPFRMADFSGSTVKPTT